MTEPAAAPTGPRAEVGLAELFAVFWRIGWLSLGGPAAQIALMHRELVERKAWLDEQQYLNGLSFCMLLPGPEAMQLATYAGWRLRGVVGGLLAGGLFVLPGAAVIFALASAYAVVGELPLTQSLFLGVKAVVLVVVVEALLKIAKRAFTLPVHRLIAGLAFVGIFFLALPFPLIVLAAGLAGACLPAPAAGAIAPGPAPPLRHTLRTLLLGAAIWVLPVLLLDAWTGGGILSAIAAFFAKLAVVTFGGAYAVLAYMAQDVVHHHGWLSAGEMLDGLGLAETTPGPLILVTQFVGFMAAYHQGGLGLALIGGAVTLWVTFVPCFVWIFAGAPYIDRLSAQPRLRGALQAITAAVTGVILHLSLWFGLHVLFAVVEHQRLGPLSLWTPQLDSLEWRAVLIAVVAAVALLRFQVGLVWVLLSGVVMAGGLVVVVG